MRALTLFTVTLAMVLGLSTGAQAALSMTVTADQATYSISDTITLTINGDSNGLTSLGVFGTMEYMPNISSLGTGTQKALKHTGGIDWNVAALQDGNPNPGTVDAFAQFGFGSTPIFATKKLTAVMTFHANASGIAVFSWRTVPGFQVFDWFGLAAPAGVTVTIVPEPATAGLMGLGLLGLVVAGRRRKS